MSATFEYLEVLGEGTSGAVYRARDEAGHELAVKLFRSNVADDAALVRRFQRELEVATALVDENLVATYGGGRTESGRLFIATELVTGGDVHVLQAALGRLAEAAALSIVRDALAGLACLHRHELVHRDVKPENILLDREGCAKLGDFGLAKISAPDGARITVTGEVIGTPFYLAPEQVRGQKDVDIRADLYAAGAVLYELLAGRPPFTGKTVVDVVGAHLREPPPHLAVARPDVQAGTAALVATLLEKDRGERPPAPDSVLAALDVLLPDRAAGRAAVREAMERARMLAPPAPRARPSLSASDAIVVRLGVAPRAKLVLRGPGGTLVLFAFAGERLRLGRDAVDRSQNDVCLRVRGPGGEDASRKIATSHLRLDLGPTGASVRDLGSKTGTRLDGTRLAAERPAALPAVATLSLGGALELEARTIGAGAALVVLRPQNGPEHAYALVRERLALGLADGAPALGAEGGAALTPRAGGFAIDGKPVEPGDRVRAGGLDIEVDEIQATDMK